MRGGNDQIPAALAAALGRPGDDGLRARRDPPQRRRHVHAELHRGPGHARRDGRPRRPRAAVLDAAHRSTTRRPASTRSSRRRSASCRWARTPSCTLQFSDRHWYAAGNNGNTYADTGYQATWEVTRAQPGAPGILVDYTGGTAGASFGTDTVQNYAPALPRADRAGAAGDLREVQRPRDAGLLEGLSVDAAARTPTGRSASTRRSRAPRASARATATSAASTRRPTSRATSTAPSTPARPAARDPRRPEVGLSRPCRARRRARTRCASRPSVCSSLTGPSMPFTCAVARSPSTGDLGDARGADEPRSRGPATDLKRARNAACMCPRGSSARRGRTRRASPGWAR